MLYYSIVGGELGRILSVRLAAFDIITGWVNNVRVDTGMSSTVLMAGYIIGLLVDYVHLAELAGAVNNILLYFYVSKGRLLILVTIRTTCLWVVPLTSVLPSVYDEVMTLLCWTMPMLRATSLRTTKLFEVTRRMILLVLLLLSLVRNFMRLRPILSNGMLRVRVTLDLCRTSLLLLNIMIRLTGVALRV